MHCASVCRAELIESRMPSLESLLNNPIPNFDWVRSADTTDSMYSVECWHDIFFWIGRYLGFLGSAQNGGCGGFPRIFNHWHTSSHSSWPETWVKYTMMNPLVRSDKSSRGIKGFETNLTFSGSTSSLRIFSYSRDIPRVQCVCRIPQHNFFSGFTLPQNLTLHHDMTR